MSEASAPSLRLDKWLWFARFCKTRSQASGMCRAGEVRVNRAPVRKSNHPVRVGDVLTFAQGPRVRVVRVEALGERRGPAAEAQALYADLSPPPPVSDGVMAGLREAGSGRPTKRDRRETDRLRGR